MNTKYFSQEILDYLIQTISSRSVADCEYDLWRLLSQNQSPGSSIPDFNNDTIFTLRRYSQTQSPGSSIPDFIKDDNFVLISCQSGSYDLGKEICSLIGLHFFLSPAGLHTALTRIMQIF